MSAQRASWVEVNRAAIRHNTRTLKRMVGDSRLLAVVKANGYGHGAVTVAEAALAAGADGLCVALVQEGVELRRAGIENPILVLSEQPLDQLDELLAHGLIPTAYSIRYIDALAEAARRHDVFAHEVHLKIDTGMHRVGAWPPSEATGLARAVIDSGLHLDGVFTHFACADSDPEFTQLQFSRFTEAVDAMEQQGFRPHLRHAANSAATISFPASHMDVVRVGLALYGLSAGPGMEDGLLPALRLRSRVSSVRHLDQGEALSYGQVYRLHSPSTVATVPIGYADGFPRVVSPGAEVLIGGRRFPVAGRVTMDMILIDCGDASVNEGDEVVLIGDQGGERIAVERLAALASTIPYEIVTGLGPRIPREHRA